MGLKAYFTLKLSDGLTQKEFLEAVRELESTPGVCSADPVIGSVDIVAMVDTPITVEALAKRIRARPWVKSLDALPMVSIFEHHARTDQPTAKT